MPLVDASPLGAALLPRGRGLIALLGLGAAVLLVASCDGPGAVPGGGPAGLPVAPGSTVVEYSRMPTGVSLPAPTEQVRSQATLATYRAADPTATDGTPKSGAGESPYGCYLASRPYSEAVEFRRVYLYFPKAMIERAGSETRRFTYRVYGTRKGATDTTGVRYAHCVIPEVDGARATAMKQLLKNGEDDATKEVVGQEENGPSAKTGCDIVKVTEYCDYGGCNVISVSVISGCSGGEGGNDGGGGGSGGAGDGGGGFSGSEPTSPYPDDSGGGEEDGGDGDGSCQEIDPEPGSNCEPTDPPQEDDVKEAQLCPEDPLKDMNIRATGCKAEGDRKVEGGRFGGRGGGHEGLDLKAEVGTELYSPKGGEVRLVDEHNGGWGKHVLVETNGSHDGQTVQILYAHLKTTSVVIGETLSEGEKIGETGVSGNAEKKPCEPGGPSHVHVETKSVGEGQQFNKADHFDPESFIGTEFGKSGDPLSDKCG